MHRSTKQIVTCALFAAVICVLAPLAIPIRPVPISLATLTIMFTASVLGASWGTAATGIYLLLGLIGVPVFAGWTAGISKLAGPGGGYLIGYLPLAFFLGLIYGGPGRHGKGFVRYVRLIAGMVVGTAVLYALGTAWYCFSSGTPLAKALAFCVTPFLPGDLLKMIAVALIAPAVEQALTKAGMFQAEAAHAR